MNQIKFAGSDSISAQPLRTPGRAQCTTNQNWLPAPTGDTNRGIVNAADFLAPL